MICQFTGTPCRGANCYLWDEEKQVCRFVLAINKLLEDSGLKLIRLTKTQKKILVLMAKGYNNMDIVKETHLAIGTVKNHISAILRSLGAKSRTDAVVIALKHELVSL
jgi:DNA-binding NarL/FixJ family response regulator